MEPRLFQPAASGSLTSPAPKGHLQSSWDAWHRSRPCRLLTHDVAPVHGRPWQGCCAGCGGDLVKCFPEGCSISREGELQGTALSFRLRHSWAFCCAAYSRPCLGQHQADWGWLPDPPCSLGVRMVASPSLLGL